MWGSSSTTTTVPFSALTFLAFHLLHPELPEFMIPHRTMTIAEPATCRPDEVAVIAQHDTLEHEAVAAGTTGSQFRTTPENESVFRFCRCELLPLFRSTHNREAASP